MIERARAIFEWGRTHQKILIVGSGLLFVLLRTIDWIGDWLGRGEVASQVFNFAWDAVMLLGPWCIFIPLAAVLLYAHWPTITRRILGPAFQIRPICGETLFVSSDVEVIARLAITNVSGRPLRGVSVRLVGAYKILEQGVLWKGYGMAPSIHAERGETFLLRWSAGESATADHKYLDIPNDGAERIADCLVLDRMALELL